MSMLKTLEKGQVTQADKTTFEGLSNQIKLLSSHYSKEQMEAIDVEARMIARAFNLISQTNVGIMHTRVRVELMQELHEKSKAKELDYLTQLYRGTAGLKDDAALRYESSRVNNVRKSILYPETAEDAHYVRLFNKLGRRVETPSKGIRRARSSNIHE